MMVVASFFFRKLCEIGLVNLDQLIIDHDNARAIHPMHRKQVALLLKKRNTLDDDSDDPEVTVVIRT